MSKEGEEYRAQMLRRLKEEDSRPPPSEVLEAQKVIAKYREKQASRPKAIARASAPLPDQDQARELDPAFKGEPCPACWISHGRLAALRPVDSADHIDRFSCPACGYAEERDV